LDRQFEADAMDGKLDVLADDALQGSCVWPVG
jgi:hypothetical protein